MYKWLFRYSVSHRHSWRSLRNLWNEWILYWAKNNMIALYRKKHTGARRYTTHNSFYSFEPERHCSICFPLCVEFQMAPTAYSSPLQKRDIINYWHFETTDVIACEKSRNDENEEKHQMCVHLVVWMNKIELIEINQIGFWLILFNKQRNSSTSSCLITLFRMGRGWMLRTYGGGVGVGWIPHTPHTLGKNMLYLGVKLTSIIK